MKIAAPYLHRVNGRIRVKIPAVRRSPARAREVERELLGFPGVQETRANPTTGNVLILYDDERVDEAAILRLLEDQDWLNESSARPRENSGLAHRLAVAVVESALQGLGTALII
jgi:copper chaperone CopZ